MDAKKLIHILTTESGCCREYICVFVRFFGDRGNQLQNICSASILHFGLTVLKAHFGDIYSCNQSNHHLS